MKKKELIHLIELMICKYEIAIKSEYIEITYTPCPLCKYTTNKYEEGLVNCKKCILPNYFNYPHSQCLHMYTSPKTRSISSWHLRLRFWTAVLKEVKQINYSAFFTNLSSIKEKLHEVDREVWYKSN